MPCKMSRFVSQKKTYFLCIWKVFAMEANRQMLVVSFWLYEVLSYEFTNNYVFIVWVSSGSLLVRVARMEKSLLTVTKAFLVTLERVFIIICN